GLQAPQLVRDRHGEWTAMGRELQTQASPDGRSQDVERRVRRCCQVAQLSSVVHPKLCSMLGRARVRLDAECQVIACRARIRLYGWNQRLNSASVRWQQTARPD